MRISAGPASHGDESRAPVEAPIRLRSCAGPIGRDHPIWAMTGPLAPGSLRIRGTHVDPCILRGRPQGATRPPMRADWIRRRSTWRSPTFRRARRVRSGADGAGLSPTRASPRVCAGGAGQSSQGGFEDGTRPTSAQTTSRTRRGGRRGQEAPRCERSTAAGRRPLPQPAAPDRSRPLAAATGGLTQRRRGAQAAGRTPRPGRAHRRGVRAREGKAAGFHLSRSG